MISAVTPRDIAVCPFIRAIGMKHATERRAGIEPERLPSPGDPAEAEAATERSLQQLERLILHDWRRRGIEIPDDGASRDETGADPGDDCLSHAGRQRPTASLTALSANGEGRARCRQRSQLHQPPEDWPLPAEALRIPANR